MDALRDVLTLDGRVAYALVFGSAARGSAHANSDLDVAVGLMPGVMLTPLDLGTLCSDLEAAAGRVVDLVLLDEATPALAYRIFRHGTTVLERDRTALVDRKTRAILEYLDFKPTETLTTRGVLAAAARG